MGTQHIVTAAFVKVSIGSPSGNRVAQLIQRGGIVPTVVDAEQLERLVDRGLIAPIEVLDPDEEAELLAALEAEEQAETARLEAENKAAADRKAEDARLEAEKQAEADKLAVQKADAARLEAEKKTAAAKPPVK